MCIRQLMNLQQEYKINHSPVCIWCVAHLPVMVFLLMMVMLRCCTVKAAQCRSDGIFAVVMHGGEIAGGFYQGCLSSAFSNRNLSQTNPLQWSTNSHIDNSFIIHYSLFINFTHIFSLNWLQLRKKILLITIYLTVKVLNYSQDVKLKQCFWINLNLSHVGFQFHKYTQKGCISISK